MQRIPSDRGLLACWDPTDSIMRRANVVFQGRRIKGGPVPRPDNGTSKWHVKLPLRCPIPPAFDFGKEKCFLLAFLHICKYLCSTSQARPLLAPAGDASSSGWAVARWRNPPLHPPKKREGFKGLEVEGGRWKREEQKLMCIGGKMFGMQISLAVVAFCCLN